MSWIDGILYGLLAVLLWYFGMAAIMFWVLWVKVNKKEEEKEVEQFEPHVSILVAARNEEDNIGRCLNALGALDYPKEKLQILIGNDDSEDATEWLVNEFITTHPNVEMIEIEPSEKSNLRGKPNVLATLFKKATGEYVFITDADIAVNPLWIKGMLAGLKREGADAASGTTFVHHENQFHLFQTIEWMEALGFLYASDQLNLQVTAVGNNMVIRKAAYEAVGGYEAIPFSVTEDLDLYLALKKKGFTHRLFLEPSALAWTNPLHTFRALFKQRKRWLKGVERTPFLGQVYLGMHAIFGLFIMILSGYSPWYGFSLYVLSLIMHYIRLKLVTKITGVAFRKRWWIHVLLIDWYQTAFNVCLLIYFVLPTGVEWKKRRYV